MCKEKEKVRDKEREKASYTKVSLWEYQSNFITLISGRYFKIICKSFFDSWIHLHIEIFFNKKKDKIFTFFFHCYYLYLLWVFFLYYFLTLTYYLVVNFFTSYFYLSLFCIFFSSSFVFVVTTVTLLLLLLLLLSHYVSFKVYYAIDEVKDAAEESFSSSSSCYLYFNLHESLLIWGYFVVCVCVS